MLFVKFVIGSQYESPLAVHPPCLPVGLLVVCSSVSLSLLVGLSGCLHCLSHGKRYWFRSPSGHLHNIGVGSTGCTALFPKSQVSVQVCLRQDLLVRKEVFIIFDIINSPSWSRGLSYQKVADSMVHVIWRNLLRNISQLFYDKQVPPLYIDPSLFSPLPFQFSRGDPCLRNCPNCQISWGSL